MGLGTPPGELVPRPGSHSKCRFSSYPVDRHLSMPVPRPASWPSPGAPKSEADPFRTSPRGTHTPDSWGTVRTQAAPLRWPSTHPRDPEVRRAQFGQHQRGSQEGTVPGSAQLRPHPATLPRSWFLHRAPTREAARWRQAEGHPSRKMPRGPAESPGLVSSPTARGLARPPLARCSRPTTPICCRTAGPGLWAEQGGRGHQSPPGLSGLLGRGHRHRKGHSTQQLGDS